MAERANFFNQTGGYKATPLILMIFKPLHEAAAVKIVQLYTFAQTPPFRLARRKNVSKTLAS